MSNQEKRELTASLTIENTGHGECKAHLCFSKKVVETTIPVYNQKREKENALLEFDDGNHLIGLRLVDESNDPDPSKTESPFGITYTKEDVGAGSIAYLQFTPCPPGGVERTIIAANENGEELGINLDIDAEGHVLGIELMDGSQLPVNTEDASS